MKEALIYALTHPNSFTLVICPSHVQAFYHFEQAIGPDYIPLSETSWSMTKMELKLKNGAVVRFVLYGDHLRGLRPNAVADIRQKDTDSILDGFRAVGATFLK